MGNINGPGGIGVCFFLVLFLIVFSACAGEIATMSPGSFDAKQSVVANSVAMDTQKVGGRIDAVPIGTGQVFDLRREIDIAMVLNDQQDRVGAEATMFENPQLYYDSQADYVKFSFPQLRVDLKAKAVFMGDTKVAVLDNNESGVHPVKDYHLGYELYTKMLDDGFEKHEQTYMRVFLEPKMKSESKEKNPSF